jgi:hypothetical protein
MAADQVDDGLERGTKVVLDAVREVTLQYGLTAIAGTSTRLDQGTTRDSIRRKKALQDGLVTDVSLDQDPCLGTYIDADCTELRALKSVLV